MRKKHSYNFYQTVQWRTYYRVNIVLKLELFWPQYFKVMRLHCILGWGDLVLFSIFENLHISAVLGTKFQKSAISAARAIVARAAKFSFFKNHKDLKI